MNRTWDPSTSESPATGRQAQVEPMSVGSAQGEADVSEASGSADDSRPDGFVERLRQQVRRVGAYLSSSLYDQAALPLAGMALFLLLILRGTRSSLQTIGIVDGEPLYLPLYPWLVQIYDAIGGTAQTLETPGHYVPLAALQILGGLAAAWWLARCLRETFTLPPWGAPVAALLLLLPYLVGSEPIGNTIGVAALAYPLFMVALCFLLQSYARGNWRYLVGFLLLMPLLMLSDEPFVFLCPAVVFVLTWLLNGYEGPRGPKLALIAVFLGALLAAFLFERLVNLGQHDRFVSAPVSGIHKIVAPLYLSEPEDEQLFVGEPRLRALFHAFQSRMAARNLRRADAVNGLVPADELVGHYQASYGPIMRDVVLPILEQRGRDDWFEIDRVTREIGWRLLRERPGAWTRLSLESTVHGLGGFYPMTLLLAALAIAGFVQLRRRDALSLTLATILLFHLMNVATAALLGNPTRAAALYTEPVVIVLLLATLTRLLVPPEEETDDEGDEAEAGGGTA